MNSPDAGSDTAVIARRGMCLTVLSALMSGATPEALRPQLPALAASVAAAHFCIQPPGIDDDRAVVYTGTQIRLCAFLTSLIERAGERSGFRAFLPLLCVLAAAVLSCLLCVCCWLTVPSCFYQVPMPPPSHKPTPSTVL